MVDRGEDRRSTPSSETPIAGTTDEERSRELDRMIALSDGVFAFAMTLLVINVEIPDLTETQARRVLIDQIGDLWPQILSYVIGFLVIGLLWSWHRRIYARVQVFDSALARLNILLLMMVAFLPFPTGILGQYGELAFPAVFYAVVLTSISIVYIVTLDYLDGHRELMTRDGDGFDFPRAKARHLVSTIIFLLSIPVSWLAPGAGQAIWLLLTLNHRITDRVLPYLPRRFQERPQS